VFTPWDAHHRGASRSDWDPGACPLAVRAQGPAIGVSLDTRVTPILYCSQMWSLGLPLDVLSMESALTDRTNQAAAACDVANRTAQVSVIIPAYN